MMILSRVALSGLLLLLVTGAFWLSSAFLKTVLPGDRFALSTRYRAHIVLW